MKKVLITLAVAAACSTAALADAGAAAYGKCIACHGAKAEKKALGKSQVIAGWPVEKVVAALKGYKDGSYGGPMKGLMKGQVASYDDAKIEAVAKYISGLK
jgi:cytochrome c